ncbi:hypothetical protein C8R44DRAFT_786419 [Mycena epipterygia]|nr:hypothetical protein C8R44DRAFT_786419 [Mycena epipterygia]
MRPVFDSIRLPPTSLITFEAALVSALASAADIIMCATPFTEQPDSILSCTQQSIKERCTPLQIEDIGQTCWDCLFDSLNPPYCSSLYSPGTPSEPYCSSLYCYPKGAMPEGESPVRS